MLCAILIIVIIIIDDLTLLFQLLLKGSGANWHPGKIGHKLRGDVLAYYFLGMFLDALHDIKEYSAVCSVEENVLDEEGKEDKSAEEIKQEKKKAKKEKKEKEKEKEKEKKEEEEEEEEEEKEKDGEKEKEEEEGKEKQESQEEKGSKASAKGGDRKQRKDKIVKIRDGGLGGGIGAGGGGERKKKEKKGDGTLSVDTISTPPFMKNVIEGNIPPVTTSSLPSNKHTSAHKNTQANSQRKLNTNSHIRKYGALDSVAHTCHTHQSTQRNSIVRTLSDTTVSSPVCITITLHLIILTSWFFL